MSRVFDALTKANDQKRRQEHEVNGSSQEFKIEERTAIEEGDATVQPSRNGNGRVFEMPYSARPLVADIKTWRERIEEWCFGWDLRRYNNYPIVALEKDSPAAEQYKILREQIKRLRAESGLRT